MAGERPRVRVGLVGAGFVARVHAEAYRHLRGVDVELRWVTARRTERAHAFAQEFGVRDVADDVRRILDDPAVDVVDLCVPNAAHASLGLEAARAGKHVIVEKPLTGFFGDASTPRAEMLRAALATADALIE